MSDTRSTGSGTSGRVSAPKAVGAAASKAAGVAVDTASRLLKSALRMPGLVKRGQQVAAAPVAEPGARPGIESVANVDTPPEPGEVVIRCIDYSLERVETTDVSDLPAFLESPGKPDWATVRWLNIDGLHPYVVKHLTDAYGIHTLAAEDVIRVPQRPKVEPYDSDLFFVVARMLMLTDASLVAEQISIFYQPGLVISFQEYHGDVWEPIRLRIASKKTRLRNSGADYLLYALLDAVVDHCFPILEQYGDIMQEMEHDILDDPQPQMLAHLQTIKRQLSTLRRVMWPLRDVIDTLHRDESDRISPSVQTYLRDVYDHAVQVIDIVETYRELAGGLTDLYMSAVSNRMNEVMKVLTIIATIFIPITFLAGIYGMNFEHMPELKWQYAYPTFWLLTFCAVTVMLIYFRRKKWI